MSLNDPQVQFKKIKDSKHVEAYSVIGYNNKKVRNIVIPDNYRGLPVISISAGAFQDYKYLKNVTLPDSVISILDDAFKNCTSLNNIHLSKNLSFIGAMAFENCKSLEYIELPDSILFLGKNVFRNCRKLRRLALPLAFCQRLKDREAKDILPLIPGCRKLEMISLPCWVSLSSLYLLCQKSKPKTLQLIDLYLIHKKPVLSLKVKQFLSSIETLIFTTTSQTPLDMNSFILNVFPKLKSILLPSSLITIPSFAISNIDHLKKLVIPKSVKTIQSRAFHYLKNLHAIQLPHSLTRIEDEAFYHCEEVKIVIYNGTKEELSQISKPKLAFNDIRTNSIMCVDGYYHIKERYTKALTKNL